jgi:hypothetical protein
LSAFEAVLPTRFLEDAHQTIKRLKRLAICPLNLVQTGVTRFSESEFKQEENPKKRAAGRHTGIKAGHAREAEQK